MQYVSLFEVLQTSNDLDDVVSGLDLGDEASAFQHLAKALWLRYVYSFLAVLHDDVKVAFEDEIALELDDVFVLAHFQELGFLGGFFLL